MAICRARRWCSSPAAWATTLPVACPRGGCAVIQTKQTGSEAAEGVTILRVHRLLTPHVFIGVVLIPPVLLKVASTTWRFTRYYTGAAAYRRKGPPPVLLRLLGPVVVILTLVLLFSGVGLLLVSGPGCRCC